MIRPRPLCMYISVIDFTSCKQSNVSINIGGRLRGPLSPFRSARSLLSLPAAAAQRLLPFDRQPPPVKLSPVRGRLATPLPPALLMGATPLADPQSSLLSRTRMMELPRQVGRSEEVSVGLLVPIKLSSCTLDDRLRRSISSRSSCLLQAARPPSQAVPSPGGHHQRQVGRPSSPTSSLSLLLSHGRQAAATAGRHRWRRLRHRSDALSPDR